MANNRYCDIAYWIHHNWPLFWFFLRLKRVFHGMFFRQHRWFRWGRFEDWGLRFESLGTTAMESATVWRPFFEWPFSVASSRFLTFCLPLVWASPPSDKSPRVRPWKLQNGWLWVFQNYFWWVLFLSLRGCFGRRDEISCQYTLFFSKSPSANNKPEWFILCPKEHDLTDFR